MKYLLSLIIFILPALAQNPEISVTEQRPLFHFQKAVVVEGDKIAGSQLGCPTANIYPNGLNLSSGVYVGRVQWDGQTWGAMMYVPSEYQLANEPKCKGLFEVHLIDLPTEKSNLYGQVISGDVLSFIRHPVPWTTVEAMKEKLEADIYACRLWIEKNSQ